MKVLSNKKKILIVCNSQFVFEKFIKESLSYYTKKKIECDVVIGTEKQIKKNKFFIPMPTNSILTFHRFITAAYKIYKVIKNNQYNAVIHNNRNASICSRIAIFFLSTKIRSIYFSRGMYFHDDQNFLSKFLSKLIEILFLLRTNLILSQNKEDLNSLKKFISFFNVKTRYIGNGVDIKKFSIKKIKFKKNSFNFCTICRVSKGKGLEDLIINFKKILKLFPMSKLLIIGGPRNSEDKKYYHYLYHKYELKNFKDKIKFTGLTNNVSNYLEKNDIYIHPSKREGMPRSLIEAMSSGLVCISSNVRGSRELIKNNINGFIYYSNDELLKLMIKVFTLKKNKIKKISNFSSNFIRENFSQQKYLSIQSEYVRMIL